MCWLIKLSTSIASMKRQMLLPHAFSLTHTWLLVLLVGLIILAGTPWTRASYAIGPTLPLRFEDVPDIKNPWVIGLLVEPEQIRVVRIERHVYVDGERRRVESIETKYERSRGDEHAKSRVQLPLHFKEMEEFKRKCAFAQKIIVEGQWLKEPSAKPLQLQRWFYFILKDDKIRRVDLEEYSNFTDPVEADIDSRGRQGLVNRGRDLKAAVPLPETKGTPAIPIGPLGGAIEERVPQKGKRTVQEMDWSEVDEK